MDPLPEESLILMSLDSAISESRETPFEPGEGLLAEPASQAALHARLAKLIRSIDR